MQKSWITYLLLTISLMIIQSCAFSIKVPKGNYMLNPSGSYLAGAAQVDITPPPGYSMGGFGNELSKISRGFWTRLYSKAFYYESPDGSPIIIVSTDLWSVSQGLCDLVLSELHKYGPAYKIPREYLLVAATHTHHSPGNFSSSMGYNLGSSALKGFDEDLFGFLAGRIAYSIKLAMDNASEANIYFEYQALTGQTRNRSIDAFYANNQQVQNEILDRILFDSSYVESSSFCLTQDTNVFKAIDPIITTIVSESPTTNELRSVLSVFAVHPTVMGPYNPLYSSDIFGVASVALKNRIDELNQSNEVVVGFLNGANGDISANWHRQDRQNALRIGKRLAKASLSNSFSNQRALVSDPIICKLDFKEMRNAQINNFYSELICSGDTINQLAGTPSMGKPSKKGAEDGRVDGLCMEDECFYTEANPKDDCDGRQGKKKEMAITKLISASAPDLIPVGIYKLGKLKLISMPGETCTVLAEQLKTTNKTPNDNHISVVSLANEYASYFTSPEEYNTQHYEGASTIYGLATAMFFIEFSNRINSSLPRTDSYYNKKKYNPGPSVNKESVQGKFSDYPWNFDDELLRVYQSNDPRQKKRYYQFDWTGNMWFNKKLPENPGAMVNPSVQVYSKDPNGNWERLKIENTIDGAANSYKELQNDEDSTNFINYVKTKYDLSLSWSTVWIIPEEYQSNQEHKLIINRTNGTTIESPEFTISQ